MYYHLFTAAVALIMLLPLLNMIHDEGIFPMLPSTGYPNKYSRFFLYQLVHMSLFFMPAQPQQHAQHHSQHDIIEESHGFPFR